MTGVAVVAGTAGCYSCSNNLHPELWLFGFMLFAGIYLVLKDIVKDLLNAQRRKRNTR